MSTELYFFRTQTCLSDISYTILCAEVKKSIHLWPSSKDFLL